MKIGLFPPFSNPWATPEYLQALGPAAEERGFHSIWAAEHVVLFEDYASVYPYSPDGRFPASGETGLMDPFVTLSFLAAVTKRIRLGTGICLLPQRNPVYTAKEAATVDTLSNGRFDMGIGIGWLAEEYRVLQAPFAGRADRCRSYIEVMKRLWCDPVSEYKDEFYELPACRQYPKPVQEPHPPIHFGGESNAALRRVADLGQGWYGFNIEPEEAAERIGVLGKLLAARGRSLDEIEISVCPYMKTVDLDKVKRYADAGVDQVILLAMLPATDAIAPSLDHLAESILEPAKNL